MKLWIFEAKYCYRDFDFSISLKADLKLLEYLVRLAPSKIFNYSCHYLPKAGVTCRLIDHSGQED